MGSDSLDSVLASCGPTGCRPAGSDLWGRLSLKGQRTSCCRFIDPQFLSSPALAHFRQGCHVVPPLHSRTPTSTRKLSRRRRGHNPTRLLSSILHHSLQPHFFLHERPRHFSRVYPANSPTAYRIFKAAQQMRPRRRSPATRANLRDMLGCPTHTNEQQVTTRATFMGRPAPFGRRIVVV
jgi:hypothetical protein